MEFVLLLVTAYLMGSVPAAYLGARLSRGIDIRQYGSGNVGISNLLRLTSKRVALPVLAYDLLKGVLPMWLAGTIGFSLSQQLLVGLAAVIGHCWPVFLKFSGGRGVLTYLGVVLFLAPRLSLILLTITFIFGAFHQMALAGILVISLFPVFSYFSGAPVISWIFGRSLDNLERWPVTLVLLALLLVIIIRRLTVPRSSLSSGLSTGELLLNRLLQDRDIRDRDTWVNRKPDSAGEERKKGKAQLR